MGSVFLSCSAILDGRILSVETTLYHAVIKIGHFKTIYINE